MNTVNLPFHCSLLSAQFFSLPEIFYIYMSKYIHLFISIVNGILLLLFLVDYCWNRKKQLSFVHLTFTHLPNVLINANRFYLQPLRSPKSTVTYQQNKIIYYFPIDTNYSLFLPNYLHLNFQSSVDSCLISDFNRSSFSIYN